MLIAAEAADVELVRARRGKDAAAATGERLGEAKASPGTTGWRQIPDPLPFVMGSTVSGSRIRSGLDTFIRQYTARSGPHREALGLFVNPQLQITAA